jgi:hypothetical protein
LRARPGIRVRVGQIYQGSSPFYRARTPRAKTVINTNCPAVRQRGGSARSNTVATFEESSVNSGIRQAASRDAARQARGIPSCYCRRALGQQRPELWRFGFLSRTWLYDYSKNTRMEIREARIVDRLVSKYITRFNSTEAGLPSTVRKLTCTVLVKRSETSAEHSIGNRQLNPS